MVKSTFQNYGMMLMIKVAGQKLDQPQKLSSREKRAIASSILNFGAKTVEEMTRLINSDSEDKVSPETIRRALKINA